MASEMGPVLETGRASAADLIKRCYGFGAFHLDAGAGILTCGGAPVSIGSHACALLVALVEHRDRVVSKEELIRIAWPRSVVDRNSLPVAIFALRQVFKDQFLIRNVYRRGYQFVGAVTQEGEPGQAAPNAVPVDRRRAEQPSIVVLPFVSTGSDGSHQASGDGLAEDLIGALARHRWLRVVARNSTFAFRGGAMSVEQIAEKLGARYVLEGSIRFAGGRMRVTAQLNDAVSNTLLVSERYDRVVTEIFTVQDEIAGRIVKAVSPALLEAEQHRSLRTPPETIDAWTAYQRGIWYLGRWNDDDLRVSLDWFKRAIALDPRYAPGHYGAAQMLCRAGSGYSLVAPADWQSQASVLAEEGVRLDPRDSAARVALGWAHYMRGELPGAITAANEAMALNPGQAAAYALLGASLVFNGQAAEGIEALQASIDLDPYDPRIRVRQMHIGLGLYFRHDLAAAEQLAAAMIRAWPHYSGAYRLMGMVLAETDRPAAALDQFRRSVALSAAPFDNFVRERMPWYRPGDFARVLNGLRAAGWEGPGVTS